MTNKTLPPSEGMPTESGMGYTAGESQEAFAPEPPVKPAIGTEEIRKAMHVLQQYRQGKANLDNTIIENERWYKMRHWECLRSKDKSGVDPVSGWLFNAIANKHADAMDNFPAPTVLPREDGDTEEAKALSSIIPVILEQNGFEEEYDKIWDYKLKTGTGVYGVFWDKDKLHGMGDISIRKIDLLNLFWEPGLTDIQRSRNFFHVEMQDNEALEELYPQLRGNLSGGFMVGQYIHDESISTAEKTAVIDWYYKRRQDGRTVLHYCKFVGDIVLFATENEPEFAARGLYDHGMYPFHYDPLFRMEDSPCGFGYIDIGKSAQEYIDRGNKAIMKNMLANTSPRYFLRSDGAVNKDEFADLTNDFVTADGNLGQDSILPIQGKPLNAIYVDVINNKVDELKEVTGNRDISTGGTTSGVTAASAIAAMQEAGSKLSRDHCKASYRVFKGVCLMVIELIRQFYTTTRMFRILGENGGWRYVAYENSRIQQQHQGIEMGVDTGYRVPLFDVTVAAQKASPYSRLSQNELALQFYGAGFFDPQMTDQALMCLNMMDFDRKDAVIQAVAQNGTMHQRMQMMQQQMLGMAAELDILKGTDLARQMLASMAPNQGPGTAPVPAGNFKSMEVLGGESTQEPASTRNARERVANSTTPT